MRCVSICIAIALSALFLISICSAQQTGRTATSNGNPADVTRMGGGPDTVINCVAAQNGRIPVFTSSLPPNITICNSGIYEASPYGTGPIGILNPNPVAALDVNGGVNVTTNYAIGGSTALLATRYDGTSGGFVFVGFGAGESTTTGALDTFTGIGAGQGNSSGTGNSFYGYLAGLYNMSASWNTFMGSYSGSYTEVGANTFVGAYSGGSNTSGGGNTFIGYQAGANNTQGQNNIYINNTGPKPEESNTIRIGDPSMQNAAVIAGIYGSTASGGVPVFISPNGQLGTLTSSLRFKEQVRDMGDSSSALMKLRPVTFVYKPEYDKGLRTLQYGLIAEEVAKVYPELVANDNDGQPYSVRYQYLAAMLLNEAQKQYHRVETQAEIIRRQEQKIDDLEQRLSRLEGLVESQAEIALK